MSAPDNYMKRTKYIKIYCTFCCQSYWSGFFHLYWHISGYLLCLFRLAAREFWGCYWEFVMRVGMLQQGHKKPQTNKQTKPTKKTEFLNVGTHTTATAPTFPRPLEMLPAPATHSAAWHCRTAASCHGTFRAAEEEDLVRSVRINKGEGNLFLRGTLKINNYMSRAS